MRRVFNLGIGFCAVVPAAEPGDLVIGRIAVIGVLVSGNGTNLQALLDRGLPVTAVASNRKDAYALVRAREAASRPRRSRSTATPTARSATS